MTLLTAHAFPAMGGTVEVQGAGAEDAARIEALFAYHEQVMSRFRPDSELCTVNASAGTWCQPSPTLTRAISEAVWWMDATDGVFDPTQLDALEAAGYDRSWPFAHAASRPLHPRRLARTLELDAARGIRLPQGVRIDLGGIGKGFTVDRAIESLGPGANALIDASGDLYAAGDCPDNRDTGETAAGWVIGVHDPRTAEVEGIDVALLRVRDRGVATSGSTKRRWSTPAGERYHHLIDARTGRPFDSDVLTVTVIASTATAADVLAKTAYLLGAERGLAIVHQRGADALAVTTEGLVLTTPGMGAYLL